LVPLPNKHTSGIIFQKSMNLLSFDGNTAQLVVCEYPIPVTRQSTFGAKPDGTISRYENVLYYVMRQSIAGIKRSE